MKMIKGITIHPGGKYEEIELRVLADYQDAVEGHIEFVALNLLGERNEKHQVTMYVNDSFLLGQFDIHKDFNELATGIAYVGGRQDLRLLGSVVIVGPLDRGGNDRTVPSEIVYKWIGRVKHLQKQMNVDQN